MVEVETIGLLGGGFMGAGIAEAALLAGFSVVLCDHDKDALRRTVEEFETGEFGLQRGVAVGRISEELAERSSERLKTTAEASELSVCDLVIEGIPEDLAAKQEAFERLEGIVAPTAILASNTSGFPIASVGERVVGKQRLLGLHWFGPANLTSAVELITTPETSELVARSVEAACAAMGKKAIRVKDHPERYGFAANRIYLAMVKECRAVLEDGVIAEEDLNELFRLAYGWPAGPVEGGYPFTKEGVRAVARRRAAQVGY